MKKQVLALLICLVATVSVKAQAPDWSVTASDYANSMVVVGAIKIAGQELANPDDIVAAFVDEEVRGVARPTLQDDGRYLAIMLIYSNGNIEEVSFKAYVNATGTEVDIAATLQFEADALIGDALQPYLWSDVILSNEAELISFELSGQEGASQIADSLISITMPFDTDLSAVVPVVSLSDGASLLIDGQRLSTDLIDATEMVALQVFSEDEQHTTEFLLSVSLADTISEVSTGPSDILLSKTTILENQEAGTEVGVLSAVDADQGMGHTFELVLGGGDTDNAFFVIDGTSLRTFTAFDYEIDSAYSIRLKVTDTDGETFEKIIEINVLNLDDLVTGIEDQVDFQLFPNPAADLLQLTFKSGSIGQVSTEFFSLDGNRVKRQVNMKQADIFEGQYDLGGITSGIYIIRLETGKQVVIKKFRVIH